MARGFSPRRPVKCSFVLHDRLDAIPHEAVRGLYHQLNHHISERVMQSFSQHPALDIENPRRLPHFAEYVNGQPDGNMPPHQKPKPMMRYVGVMNNVMPMFIVVPMIFCANDKSL